MNRTRISARTFSNRPAASKELTSWRDVLLLKFEEVMGKDYKGKNDVAQHPKPTFCDYFCVFSVFSAIKKAISQEMA